MELNRIKLLDKAELLQKLRQNGFTNVVDILEDKEINGGKFIDLNEIALFKWKLSHPEKRGILDCIKQIKSNPNRLFRNEEPKLPRNNSLGRNSTFPQDETSANAFKGRLANILGASAVSTGNALTLPNPHSTKVNNADKNADNNIPRNKPLPRLPPLPNRSRENQSVTNKKSVQRNIKKAPLPLPEKNNNKTVDLEESRNFKINNSSKFVIPTEMYMDMQPPKTTEIGSGDEDYLTPKETPATIFTTPRKLPTKNNNTKKILSPVPPPPPPIPNITSKNISVSKKNTSKDKSWSSHQRNLPSTSNREKEEDTYEPPPRIEKGINVLKTPNFSKSSSKDNLNNTVSDLNRKLEGRIGSPNTINTSKFFVQIVADQAEEESSYEIVPNSENQLLKENNKLKNFVQISKDNESDGTYENPPIVNRLKTIPNKYTRKTEMNKSNNYRNNNNEPTLKLDSQDDNKQITNKELENISITEKDTQKPVLTKLFGTLFKGNKTSKNVYENHSIISSETRAAVMMPVKNRPLPETPRPLPKPPVESTGPQRDQTADHCLFSKPFPPPREITPISDEGYIKLVENSNVSEESLRLFVPKQNSEKFEKGHSHHINTIDTARKENPSQSSIQTRSNKNSYFERSNATDISYDSNDKSDEEITDYENFNNHNVQTPQISVQDHLASLLAEQLRKRNLIITEQTHLTSADDDTEFEDEDNEQPVYDNTSIPNTKFHTIQKRISLFPNQSVPRNDHEDLNQQVYNNTPTPPRNVSSQMENKLRPNLYPCKVDTENDGCDEDQPVYTNSPTPSRKTSAQRNNLSPNLFLRSSPSHDGNSDDDNPSYGNIPEIINLPKININTPVRRKNNLHSNQLSITSKTLTSINSTIKDEDSEDKNSSHDIVEDRIPIYKRPLPDVPKMSVINPFKNSICFNPRPPIKDRNIPTPPSSDDENIDDENITYGNIDESTAAFKKTLPIPRIKTPNNKFKKADITLPKPPKALNYEHYMVNEHKQRDITVSRNEEDEDHDNSIFNINNEPYYRHTDRKGAKLLLRCLEDGAFLFRPSQSHFLVLTVKHQGKYYNLGIERSPNNKIRLNSDGDSMVPEFTSLRKFVQYFESEPVTFQDNKGGIIEIILKTVLPPAVY